MKKIYYIPFVLLSSFLFWACEDVIYPELPEAEPVVVIDAWLNNKSDTQMIRVKQTLPYFDVEELPGITGAEVMITDNGGKVYNFIESEINEGEYYWDPESMGAVFGDIGRSYTLTVKTGETVFNSFATMNDVPEIDSVSFRFEEGNSFFPDAYFASFYAVDLVGPGDTYWIRTYKNGTLLNKPSEINIAYDAGFSAGSLVDGITFIQPIRDGVNPFDTDDNDEFLPPYSPGDSVYVEIHSISNEAYIFLNELALQTDRPGGFAELFAQPLSNMPSNIINSTTNEKVIGFFNVAAVSSEGRLLDPDNLPTD